MPELLRFFLGEEMNNCRRKMTNTESKKRETEEENKNKYIFI